MLAMEVFSPSKRSWPKRVTEFHAPRETSSLTFPQRKFRRFTFISGRSFLVKCRFTAA